MPRAKRKPPYKAVAMVVACALSVLCLAEVALAAEYSFPQSQGPFNLNPGDRLTIASGVFTGSISGVPSGAVLRIEDGTRLEMSSSVNIAGVVEVENGGSAAFGSLTLGAGFTFLTEGDLSFASNPNMNGAGHFEIETGATLDLPGNFILANGSTLTNRGSVSFDGNLNTSHGTELLNAGQITGSSSSGTFNPNGVFMNAGLVDVQGFININTNSEVINHCSFIARVGFNNNSPKMENHGIILTTGSESALQINQPMLNAPGGYLQSDGTNGPANFTNNASAPGFHGGGSVYVAGQSRNQGVFGGSDGAVNFYDASLSGTGPFDQTNTAPHASVTAQPIDPITLPQARSTCSYSPMVRPPEAVADQQSVSVTPGSVVSVFPVENDLQGSLPIDPESLRLIDGNGVPVLELKVPGEGTWAVDQEEGAIVFTPDGASVLTPAPVSYSLADTAGNRSNTATIALEYSLRALAALAADKALVLLSEAPVDDCASFTPAAEAARGFMPGACIEYVIEVINTGPGAAEALSVRDVISEPLIFWGVSMFGFGSGAILTAPEPGEDCDLRACQVEISDATLASGAIGSIRIRMTVK